MVKKLLIVSVDHEKAGTIGNLGDVGYAEESKASELCSISDFN